MKILATVDELTRFWSMFDRGDSCWLWRGTKIANGYGQTYISGKTRSVHRVAFEVVNGPLMRGMVVMHRCDNKLCGNPRHLQAGTQSENLLDFHAKRRVSQVSV